MTAKPERFQNFLGGRFLRLERAFGVVGGVFGFVSVEVFKEIVFGGGSESFEVVVELVVDVFGEVFGVVVCVGHFTFP